MELLERFLAITDQLSDVFKQKRTVRRAASLMLAELLCLGRRWITRLILTRGRDHQDWSGDYKLFSRAQWELRRIFRPASRRTVPYFGAGPISLAADEFRARRGGRRVKRSRWTRDPMSPPFHVNFIKGIRFLQIAALLPLYRTHQVGCRSVPISVVPVDLPQRPGRRATPAEKAAYAQACQQNNMCRQAVRELRQTRACYDELGAADKLLLVSLDGGFCNRTMFGANLERTVLLARGRKDAVLCRPARKRKGSRRVYGKRKFTPQKVRTNTAIPWHQTTIFYGGQWRTVRYKEVRNVLWQGGAGRRPLRLIVVAPTPYQLSPACPRYYRQPAYLFVNDHELPTQTLLQAYFDRWQIEVNHRDEKQLIGIVDAQVWNDSSVDRVPAFMAASYSFLLLAALEAYGPERTQQYIEPPRWQRQRRRPSCLDLLNLLRQQAAQRPDLYDKVDFHFDATRLTTKMAA
jgi:hypothetical protein